jgi:hypothetical protein
VLNEPVLSFTFAGDQVRIGAPAVKPGTLPSAMLDQRESWITPDGYSHALTEFDADFCYWIITYLITYAKRLRDQWSSELRETYDTDQSAREWMIRRPVVRAFMQQLLKMEGEWPTP